LQLPLRLRPLVRPTSKVATTKADDDTFNVQFFRLRVMGDDSNERDKDGGAQL